MRRYGITAAEARKTVSAIADVWETRASDAIAMSAALDLAVDHHLQYWDAVIVSVAADAGCAMLLSEDMQDGFVVRGLTIVNPLAAELHPKLAALLSAGNA